MLMFKPGEQVAVPCTVQSGAFPGEYLVTVNTITGPISGFAKEGDMVDRNALLHGVVRQAAEDVLAIWLAGSFFTTNGLAEFSTSWARDNLRALAA